ncbi:hypothetical protein CTEN210_02776 [Chaetoceros tenuissimus]|uniref:Uncharacterized protein n=1 Tax=Chaetoceros tenuissimus TaxID=426638 RepID=A0AAD3CHN4_9STRA|nr:hypothetical protein CTEN210_02776 [Chaetoceros tenuissimus]
MRVATVDGLVTLFYDGSKEPYNEELHHEFQDEWYNRLNSKYEEWNLSEECRNYWNERQSWEQVIIEEGVKEIPDSSFLSCLNIKRVVFANTVIRIGTSAFVHCQSLVYIRWSASIEFIGRQAFFYCNLSSVFIPPRCTTVESCAFVGNKNLAIFSTPLETELGYNVIGHTKLLNDSPFELDSDGHTADNAAINEWLKNINNDDKYSLHRTCASHQPLKEVIFSVIDKKGLGAFKEKNGIGISPSRYLKENPYCDLRELEIIQDYVMKMMGEI